MIKKIAFLSALVLFFLSLCGCYDYVGLNILTIVSGIAVDKDFENDEYMLTFEIISLKDSTKEEGIKNELIESRGKTIYSAIRNAKKRIDHKLYFGNTSIVILSKQIAEEGINGVLDVFFRDEELRGTLKIVISQEEKAADLFDVKEGLTNHLITADIDFIIEEDSAVTSATKEVLLYEIYNLINGEGVSLVLPAFHLTQNQDKKVLELNGSAVFDDDKLIGYISPEENKYYLFAKDRIKGGVINYQNPLNPNQMITVEISDNKTNTTFKMQKNTITVNIDIETNVYAIENNDYYEDLDTKAIEELEKNLSGALKSRVEAVINKIQNEFGSDILGIGNMIYRKDVKAWNDKLKHNWKEEFKKIKFKVSSDITVLNTALIS